jgi:outer membrane protein OmpA-like peptidoglycan-associated protein
MRYLFFVAFLSMSTLSSAQDKEILWEMKHLGWKVNSRFHDSAPIISPDGKTLYFFVADHPKNKYGVDNSQDIWYCEKDEYGEWGKAIHMESPLNTQRYNQVMSVLADGNTLLIRGSNGNSEGLSITRRSNGKWSNPVSLSIPEYERMNKGRFSGAFMTSDGMVLVLYFSETKDAKRSDLYVSFLQGGNTWSKPEKIGKPINTSLDEFGPFITADNKTMFFASNRGGGYGSSDIYRTERLDDTWLNWSKPVNIGPPVNTDEFDAYFSMDASGTEIFTTRALMTADGGSLDIIGLIPIPEITVSGYVRNINNNRPLEVELQYLAIKEDTGWIHTNREGFYEVVLNKRSCYEFSSIKEGFDLMVDTLDLSGTKGDLSIKKDFYMNPQSMELSGFVYNKKDHLPMSIEMTIGKTDMKSILVQSDENGFYHTQIPSIGEYQFMASKEGFINLSDSLEVIEFDPYNGITKDLYMMPIEVGVTVRLNNIFFDFDKTTLRPESIPQLDRVVQFMRDNPTVSVEIGGHTDSKGSDEYNINLSQGRAEAVVNYVIEQGVDFSRIIAKGYGESLPVDTNSTDEGRQSNRRVEFKILEIDTSEAKVY